MLEKFKQALKHGLWSLLPSDRLDCSNPEVDGAIFHAVNACKGGRAVARKGANGLYEVHVIKQGREVRPDSVKRLELWVGARGAIDTLQNAGVPVSYPAGDSDYTNDGWA